MCGYERRKEGRQHEDVEGVEARERLGAELVSAAQHAGERRADERGLLRDLRPDLGGPVGLLVPGQEVAREAEAHHDEQQHDAAHPGELARELVRAREERAQQVEPHHRHHGARAPDVEAAQQPSEGRLFGHPADRVEGVVGRGRVRHRQERSARHLEQKEKQGDAAERIDPARAARDPSREERPPDLARAETLVEPVAERPQR